MMSELLFTASIGIPLLEERPSGFRDGTASARVVYRAEPETIPVDAPLPAQLAAWIVALPDFAEDGAPVEPSAEFFASLDVWLQQDLLQTIFDDISPTKEDRKQLTLGLTYGFKRDNPFPDYWLYDLATFFRITPDAIRQMHPRDRNHLLLVRQAKQEARMRIARQNKVPLSQVPEF